MSGEAIPVEARPDVAPEDRARAEFYALLARLWYAAPEAALLGTIAAASDIPAEGEQTALAEAWRQLRAAAAAANPETVRAEYDGAFIGTGKAEITLYVSGHLVEAGRERVLVALRDELAELGLARTAQPTNPRTILPLCLKSCVISRPPSPALLRCSDSGSSSRAIWAWLTIH